MLRQATLFAIAAIALGQDRELPAWVQIDVTSGGNVHGTLTAPVDSASPQLAAAFARAIGCEPGRNREPKHWTTRVVVQCLAPRPSFLTYRTVIHLAELAPALRQAGVDSIPMSLSPIRLFDLQADLI